MPSLRDLINEPRKNQSLFKDRTRFMKLCSAMDVIEDTAMAARAYMSQKDTNDKGQLYLETYGLLQALVLQHQAIRTICEVLGVSFNKSIPVILEVSDLRARVAGHPVGTDTGPHFLVQGSLRRGSLEIHTPTSKTQPSTFVKLNDLLHAQENEIATIIQGILVELEAADAKHKAQFQGKKLETVFPNILNYCFEKINEHIRNTQLAGMGVWGIGELRRMISEFQAGMEERGIQLDTYDYIEYDYGLLAYPMNQLEAYLSGNESDIPGSQAAYIFAEFVRIQVEKLREAAKQIDIEFTS